MPHFFPDSPSQYAWFWIWFGIFALLYVPLQFSAFRYLKNAWKLLSAPGLVVPIAILCIVLRLRLFPFADLNCFVTMFAGNVYLLIVVVVSTILRSVQSVETDFIKVQKRTERRIGFNMFFLLSPILAAVSIAQIGMLASTYELPIRLSLVLTFLTVWVVIATYLKFMVEKKGFLCTKLSFAIAFLATLGGESILLALSLTEIVGPSVQYVAYRNFNDFF